MFTRDFIAARLARPAFKPSPEDKHIVGIPPGVRVTDAAVLVPLIWHPHEIRVLLTQRTSHLNDHPSQISFPGGRVEAADTDRVATALRETEEEIGVPGDRIDILGVLPEHEMPSGFRISPVVGRIEPPSDLRLDPFEVSAHFEVPLAFFMDPANYQRRHYHFNGRDRDYLAIPYEGRYIWGATAGMLYSLYRQLTDEPAGT